MTAEGLSVPGETPTTPGSVRSVRFVIAVPDLARSSAYYRDVLGFEIHEIGDPGWRVYARDACTIFAGECPDAIPPTDLGDHSYFAYLVVDEIDAFHDAVRRRGGEITKELRDEPWEMREFGVRTIDGHRVMFGTPLETDDEDEA